MYRNIGAAGASNRQAGKKRSQRNGRMGTFGPAGPAVSLVTGQVFDPEIRWPIYVTAGHKPNGALVVHQFKNRAGADAAGFPWVGRPSSVAREVGFGRQYQRRE